MNARVTLTAPPPPDLTPDARARLEGALIGARPNLLVSVKAGDVRACLGVAEAVQEAFELLGELAVTRRRLEVQTAIAASVPVLEDQVTVLRAQVDVLLNRIALAGDLLKGKA